VARSGPPEPAGAPVPQSEIGGDPVVRLSDAMPKTISTADRVRRSPCHPDAYRKAGNLLEALAAVECSFTAGGPTGVAAGLLRDLVIITGGLVGSVWLEANAETAATFTGLLATPSPPGLAELDEILASVLSSRFGLPLATVAACSTSPEPSPQPRRPLVA